MGVKSSSIDKWLSELGSKVPVPGGGAVAGLNAAISAATLKMVCEYSTGPKYAANEALMKESAEKLAGLAEEALAQAENDEKAYSKLREAFTIPKDSSGRPDAIELALQAAVEPAVGTIKTVGKILEITEEILDKSNKNLLSDVAVSAANAKAALQSAVVNIEINLKLVKDETLRASLQASVVEAEKLFGDADRLFNSARRKQEEGS